MSMEMTRGVTVRSVSATRGALLVNGSSTIRFIARFHHGRSFEESSCVLRAIDFRNKTNKGEKRFYTEASAQASPFLAETTPRRHPNFLGIPAV